MRKSVPIATAALARHGLQPLFSWDNNKIQANADLTAMGLQPHQKLPLAPYMPDAHKVIEHLFARLKTMVLQQLYLFPNGTIITPDFAQELVWRCFWAQPTAAIAADVASLPLTYAVIAADRPFQWVDGSSHTGVAGAWPPKKYR